MTWVELVQVMYNTWQRASYYKSACGHSCVNASPCTTLVLLQHSLLHMSTAHLLLGESHCHWTLRRIWGFPALNTCTQKEHEQWHTYTYVCVRRYVYKYVQYIQTDMHVYTMNRHRHLLLCTYVLRLVCYLHAHTHTRMYNHCQTTHISSH